MASIRKSKVNSKAKPPHSVSTDKQQIDVYPGRGPRNREHLAKPGVSLNPAGRPKGSRNKLGEAFLQDLLADWQDYGAFALADCRKVDPAAYCRIVASILPKELSINENTAEINAILDQFNTAEELQAFLVGLTNIGLEKRGQQKVIAPKPRS